VLISGLLASLLPTLEGRYADAATIMQNVDVQHEPETVFYFARHYAMLGDRSETLAMLQRARCEGFIASYPLAHDPVFESFRNCAEFEEEIAETRRFEVEARHALQQTGAQERLSFPSNLYRISSRYSHREV